MTTREGRAGQCTPTTVVARGGTLRSGPVIELLSRLMSAHGTASIIPGTSPGARSVIARLRELLQDPTGQGRFANRGVGIVNDLKCKDANPVRCPKTGVNRTESGAPGRSCFDEVAAKNGNFDPRESLSGGRSPGFVQDATPVWVLFP